MRQLKGKVAKESRKEKRERKEEFDSNKRSCWWVVIPVLSAIAASVAFIVFYGTRPNMPVAADL